MTQALPRISKDLLDQAGTQDRLLQAALRLYAHTAHNRLWRIHDPNDLTPSELKSPTDTLFLNPTPPETSCSEGAWAEDHAPVTPFFEQLRWGGQLVAACRSKKLAEAFVAALRAHGGFRIEQEPQPLHAPVMGMRLPGLSQQGAVVIARKTRLIQPGHDSTRCTYDLELLPAPSPQALDTHLVRKTVPDTEALFHRLKQRVPDGDVNTLLRRAGYLTQDALPYFLTREALTLQHLQKTLPEPLRARVPRLIDMQVDDAGQASWIKTSWIHPGTQPISRLAFSLQLAELVAALHDHARIAHLDLRLDNLFVGHDGVCLVDFGNAVRLDEDLNQQPKLKGLLQDVVNNAATRRDLSQMVKDRKINAAAYRLATENPGPQTDVFYLALQASRSTLPIELARMIKAQEPQETLKRLKALTAAFLRPKNIKHTPYKSAADFYRGVRRLNDRFGEQVKDRVSLAA